MSGLVTKQLSLKDAEPLARTATREALAGCDLAGLELQNLVLGSGPEYLDTGEEGEHWVFEPYVPGERPEDAVVISRTRVHRTTGQVEVEVLRTTAARVDDVARIC